MDTAVKATLPEDHGKGPEFAPDRVEDQPQGFEGDHAEQEAVPLLAEHDGGGGSLSVDGKDCGSDFPGHVGAIGEREGPRAVWLDADSFQAFFGNDGVDRPRIH